MENIVRQWHDFKGDCLLSFTKHSELTPKDLCRGMVAIEDYWKDQVETNVFQGNLQEFIKKYHLELEVCLIEEGYDLWGVDEILFEVY